MAKTIRAGVPLDPVGARLPGDNRRPQKFRIGQRVTGAYGTSLYRKVGKVKRQRGGLVDIVDEFGDRHTVGSAVLTKLKRK